MLVLFHVIIALSSLLYTAFVCIRPSKPKLRLSYAGTALTITSGTYLAWHTHAAILPACATGLLYLGMMLIGIVYVNYRLSYIARSAAGRL